MAPVKRAAGGKMAVIEASPTLTMSRKKKDKIESQMPKAQTTIAQFFSTPKASSHKADATPPRFGEVKKSGVEVLEGGGETGNGEVPETGSRSVETIDMTGEARNHVQETGKGAGLGGAEGVASPRDVKDSSDQNPGRGTKRPRESEYSVTEHPSGEGSVSATHGGSILCVACAGNACSNGAIAKNVNVTASFCSSAALSGVEKRRNIDDEANGTGVSGDVGARGVDEVAETKLRTPKTKRQRERDEPALLSAGERLSTPNRATPSKCDGSRSRGGNVASPAGTGSGSAIGSPAGSRSGGGCSGDAVDINGSSVAQTASQTCETLEKAPGCKPCVRQRDPISDSSAAMDVDGEGEDIGSASKDESRGENAESSCPAPASSRVVAARDAAKANGRKSQVNSATEVVVSDLNYEAQAKTLSSSPKAAAKSMPLEARAGGHVAPSRHVAEAKSLPPASEPAVTTSSRAPLVAAKSLPPEAKPSTKPPLSPGKVAAAKSPPPTTLAAAKSWAPCSKIEAKSVFPGAKSAAKSVPPTVKTAAKSTPSAPVRAAGSVSAGGGKGKVSKGGTNEKSVLPAHIPPHPHLMRYLSKLAVAIANAEASGNDVERPDKQMGVQEAAQNAAATAPADTVDERQGAFPETLAPLLARLVQGSMLPLSMLSQEAVSMMKELVPQHAGSLTLAKVAEKIRRYLARKDQQVVGTLGTQARSWVMAIEEVDPSYLMGLVAQRKCYGSQPKKAVIPEDISPEAVWRWEVQLMDLLPADKVAVVKQARSERSSEGKLVKALMKLTEVMAKHPSDASRISKEEEKVLAFARKEEIIRQKANLKEAGLAEKERARREKEESKEKEKKKKQEEKEAKKAEEKRLKAAAMEEEKKKQEEAKVGKVSLFNFFKVSEASQDSKENVAPPPPDQPSGSRLTGSPGRTGLQIPRCSEQGAGGSIAGGDGSEEESGASGGGEPGNVGGGGGGIAGGGGGLEVGGGGTGGAGLRSHGGFDARQLEAFERRLKEGGALEDLLAGAATERSQRVRKRKASNGKWPDEQEVIRPKRIKVTVTSGGEPFDNSAGCEEKQVEIRNRMKLLQFHQDHRPAYWGTWSKSSKDVTGRRPFGRDLQGLLNYDYDSEEDWEEEEEAQGEDLLSDEEGDKEPEDNLDYKDGWLRQDDEFSDEEKDRFDDADGDDGDSSEGQARRPIASSVATCEPQPTAALGVGVGVRIGAGAAIGGAGAGKAASSAGGVVQRAFVSSLMFRRALITDEEMRLQPALLALAAYRLIPFPRTDEGDTGEEENLEARFPIAAAEALLDKATGKENLEGDGEEGTGDGRKDGKGKNRKHKDVPDELLPALVEKLHGKPDKREDVVNAFVAEHPECTKKAVHQKVKDISTRERGLLGGRVFVVSSSVLETLGVEKEEVPLMAAEPNINASTSPGAGDKAKGAAQAKLIPAPGQRSLLSFLNPLSKGSSAGESAPPPLSSTEEISQPSSEGATSASSPLPLESVVAPSMPINQGDPNDSGDQRKVSEEGLCLQQSDSVAPEAQANALSPLREVLETPDDGAAPSPQCNRRRGPDEDGGWEEMKESEPPMGRLVPLCKVLTPCKKVRQMAAARPVLYLGSGPPPPHRAVVTGDNGDKMTPAPSLASIPALVDDSAQESRGEAKDSSAPEANENRELRENDQVAHDKSVKDGSYGSRGGGDEEVSFKGGNRCDGSSSGGASTGASRSGNSTRNGVRTPNPGLIDQARVLSVLEG